MAPRLAFVATCLVLCFTATTAISTLRSRMYSATGPAISEWQTVSKNYDQPSEKKSLVVNTQVITTNYKPYDKSPKAAVSVGTKAPRKNEERHVVVSRSSKPQIKGALHEKLKRMVKAHAQPTDKEQMDQGLLKDKLEKLTKTDEADNVHTKVKAVHKRVEDLLNRVTKNSEEITNIQDSLSGAEEDYQVEADLEAGEPGVKGPTADTTADTTADATKDTGKPAADTEMEEPAKGAEEPDLDDFDEDFDTDAEAEEDLPADVDVEEDVAEAEAESGSIIESGVPAE